MQNEIKSQSVVYHGANASAEVIDHGGKLRELLTVLNQRSDDDDIDFVKFEGTRYKMTHLPVWGSVMTDTHNVWSWDNTHYITQDLNGDGKFIVVPRGGK